MSINLSNNGFEPKYKIEKPKETTLVNSFGNTLATSPLKYDTCSFTNAYCEKIDTTSIKENLKQTKAQQGLIGKAWDGFKNLTKIGASSLEAQNAISDYENGKISQQEMEKAVNGYIEGQKMSVDVVADIVSGCLSILAFGLAVPTGGASLAVGLGASTLTGAVVKTGIKTLEKGAKQDYTSKDLLYDVATGAINGLLGPITNGIGNTLTKTVATKLGITVLKESTEEIGKQTLKQTAKNIILNQTDDIIGGTLGKRIAAQGIGMAADGALGGAGDNMVRAALDGKNILQAGAEGFVGGLIMAPVIGLGMKGAGSVAKSINGKITMSSVLPDGLATKFKQGQIGDCSLLSTIDGLMNNPTTAKTFKKSITKTIFGDYNVRIGDNVVKVAKSSLPDEMLSDTTGIKLFEQAYKQLNGSIDGGFAEAVAKQFGLNPVHIASDLITDELLDKIAKNKNNTVLSFGTLVDSNGIITNTNGTRHYFTIKNIDANSKKITLTSPIDTSKTIELNYEQVKNLGISIDGGTIGKTDLPTVQRTAQEEAFKGIKSKYGELEIVNVDYTDSKGKAQVKRRIYLSQDKKKPLEYYEICKILAPEQQEFFVNAHRNLSIDTTNYARYGALDGGLEIASEEIKKNSPLLEELYKEIFGSEIVLDKDTDLLNVQLRDVSRKTRQEIQILFDKQFATLNSIYQNTTGKELILDKNISKTVYSLQKALEELEGKNIPENELESFKIALEKFEKLKEISKICSYLQTSVLDFQKTYERMLGFDIHSEEAAIEQVGTSIRERSKSQGKKSVLLHNQDKKMFLLGDTVSSGSGIKEADLFEENRIYLTHQEFMDCINLIRNYHFMDSVRIEDKFIGEQRFISTKGFNDGDYGSLHSLHRLIQNFGLDENGKLDLNKLQATLDLISEGLYKDFRNNESLFSNAGKSSTDAQAGLLISRGKASGGKTTILFKDNNNPNSKDIITAIFDSDGCLYTIYKQDIEGTKDFIPFKTFNA